ncbi:MAG: exodeoxyribonuclease VII small subunit [Muribaculaceae bacterium]|nr:exodeoxyribonuclease VII small subunit [Muribaculaceae bacterium]
MSKEETKELTYAQASEELEQIVQKMQSPECNIDELSNLTKRAKELLELCRKKLTATDEEVKKILDSMSDK